MDPAHAWYDSDESNDLRASMPGLIFEAHSHSINHRKEIESSALCGCFACIYVFPPSEICEWMNNAMEEFAFCPRCGIDAVIGDKSGYPISTEFLLEMNRCWFDGDVFWSTTQA